MGNSTFNNINAGKGYKEARKVIDRLRATTFKHLNDEELDEFINEISSAFGLVQK